jgi:exopolyphosphatase/guanosine-5'-triphosphate,3'-diphosphate pyrophosphatase
MIAARFYSASILEGKTEYQFNLNDFNFIYDLLLKSTKEQRTKMEGLVEMRVDMIVVSSILVQFVLSSFNIKQMRLSTYSLKEGMLYQLLNS